MGAKVLELWERIFGQKLGVNVGSKLGGKTFGMKILEENLGENGGKTTNYGGQSQG